MKKYATIIMVLAALVACQKEEDFFQKEEVPQEEEKQPQNSELYTLSLQASKTIQTKALSLDNEGATLNAYWRTGETVAVYLNGSGTLLGMLTATADGTDVTKATLSGYLTTVEGVTQGSELMLLFPRADWDYTGQDGTVETIGTKYDYATASVTVASVDDVNRTISVASGASFENQQSVYRFGFKVSDTPLSVKEFTVSSDHNKLVTSRSYSGGWTSTYGSLTVTPASATSDLLYLSLRNENTNTGEPDKFSFYVIGNDNALYLGEKDIPGDKLGDGKFISAKSVAVTKSNLAKSGTATEVW